MAFKHDIAEEQLKNQVAETIFGLYDCTRIIGNIDFCIAPHAPKDADTDTLSSHAWAEAKKGRGDLDEALVQLLLTIGKARTFDRHIPPKYLAAFNADEILLIEYAAVHQVFYQNDFNWHVAPNDHATKEFRQLADLVRDTLGYSSLRFTWHDYNGNGDDSPMHVSPSLKRFISLNFNAAQTTALLPIDDHNFISVYTRWRQAVLPSIAADWEKMQRKGIIDADFYLADLMSRENQTLTEKLYVLLQGDRYALDRKVDEMGLLDAKFALFNDGQKAHSTFWRKYQRPPDALYWDYIIARRDLLVPGDVREVKGAFFTPRQWVALSQAQLAETLGPNWQQEYTVWDCAAGTGNLLQGLTNPAKVWASTLDRQDVDVMHQLIDKATSQPDAPPPLFRNQVFQFDFLNDDFAKLPEELRDIVQDPQKRQKLLIYINPPYSEAGNARLLSGTGKNKPGNSGKNRMHALYAKELGKARRELYAQFLMRIKKEIDGAKIGLFSKIKTLQGPSFSTFRDTFNSKLLSLFLVPSDTFDNVPGHFPIGFQIWDTAQADSFKSIHAKVYNHQGKRTKGKKVQAPKRPTISSWIGGIEQPVNGKIGTLIMTATDIQHNRQTRIAIPEPNTGDMTRPINAINLIPSCVYLAIREIVIQNWLNDRDQYFSPYRRWEKDQEFHADCLAYTLLNGQNRISAQEGTNHWIPFTERSVGQQNKYASHFMLDFIAGQLALTPSAQLLVVGAKPQYATGQTPIAFSPEAQALLEAGRALWQYYHAQPNANPNAAFYDIRKHFQGVNARGVMNAHAGDTEYKRLMGNLREAQVQLGEKKILPKIYEYGFLV